MDALEIPSIEGLAKSADVTAEIAAAVEPLATKQEVSEIEAKVDAIVIPDVSELASKEEVQAVDAKVDGLEIPSIEGLAKSADVTAEIAAAVEPLATKEEVNLVDAKVDALEIPSIEGLLLLRLLLKSLLLLKTKPINLNLNHLQQKKNSPIKLIGLNQLLTESTSY